MKTLILSAFLLFISVPAHAGTEIWNSPSGEPVSHSIEQSPEEVEEYWTPERMRNAQPMPMPSIDGSQGVPMPTSLEPCIGDQCPESGADGGYAVGAPGSEPGNPGEQ